MAEVTIKDNEMIHVKVTPDGAVDGVPQWSVVSGNGTMLSDLGVIANLPPAVQALWDPALPEGFQMFLVSDTLPNGVDGPVTTEYLVEADVDKGTGVELLSEPLSVHVMNQATTLGVTMSAAVKKP